MTINDELLWKAVSEGNAKAEEELTYEKYFDVVLVNDDLSTSLAQAEGLIDSFVLNK